MINNIVWGDILMYRNDAIAQNTLYVNNMLIRIYKLLLVAFAMINILKASGVIVLSWLYLIIADVVVVLICISPIAFRHFMMDENIIKYVNISCAAVLCISGFCILNTDAIILLVMPIGFACLYFDIKLIKYSSALSIAGLILGKLLNGMINWDFYAAVQGIDIRTAMGFLQFGIAGALLIAVSKRALNVLSNAHSYYENINNIFSNVQASLQSLEAAEDILLKGVNSLNAADGEDALPQNAMVKGIISNINKSVENTREIMKYTQTMLKGKNKDLKARAEITRIEEYARNSREIVLKLAICAEEISKDLSLISVMTDESNLVFANALAEAESASSKDGGSPIITLKIEKLADKSEKSFTHIRELLNNIANDAENTVKTVADTYEEMVKSLELINRTVETLIKWLMYKNMK